MIYSRAEAERAILQIYLDIDSIEHASRDKHLIQQKVILRDFTFVFEKMKELENNFFKAAHKIKDYLEPRDYDKLHALIKKLYIIQSYAKDSKKISKKVYYKILWNLEWCNEIEELLSSLKGALQRAEYGFKYTDFTPTIRKHQKLHEQLRLENEKDER